jgi:hypothetical protein
VPERLGAVEQEASEAALLEQPDHRADAGEVDHPGAAEGLARRGTERIHQVDGVLGAQRHEPTGAGHGHEARPRPADA